MKNVLLAILSICFLGNIFDLNAQNHSICGRIIDKTNSSLPYASVSLLNIKDSTLVTGTSSDENGRFCVQNGIGSYILKFSSIGYIPSYINISLKDDLNLNDVQLDDDTYNLNEVVIKSNRPAITRTADKFIVSIENSVLLKSKTLDKILNVSPGVFIDKNGVISINGISGVTVVVNGKTLRMTGSQLSSYLKSVQGQDLNNIEIISNPTSHYDAEGVGGVIRINTKRKTVNGFSGYLSSDLTRDRYFKYNEGIGLAYSMKKLTVYGNYNFGHGKAYADKAASDVSKETNIEYDYLESYKGHRNNHSYKLGLDWDVSNNHYLGVEYNGLNNLRKDTYGTSLTEIYNKGNYSGKIFANTPMRDVSRNDLFNLNYVWKIDSLGQVLKLVADYSDVSDDCQSYYYNEYFNSLDELTDQISKKQDSDEKIMIYSTQLDYEKKINQIISYSTGFKYSKVKTKYRYWFFLKNEPSKDYVLDDQQTDNFQYNEERYAGYINFNYKRKKVEANCGLRAEYTTTKGISLVMNEKNEDNNLKLFPSTFLRYNINDNHGLIFYYGARINRPDYSFVNPFICYLTELSVKKGNPYLKPSIMNIVEATYVLSNRYYFALKANFQNKAFSDYVYREDDITISTTKNISQINYYYFNAYIPVSLGIWDGYHSLNVGFTENKQDKETVNSFNMSFNSNNNFTLSDDLNLEFNLRFYPRSKGFYEKIERNYLKMDIGLNYTCLKDKMAFTIGVNDIINTGGYRRGSSHYNSFYRKESINSAGRSFGFGVRYNFNSGKRNLQKEKIKSNQEELNRI